MLRIGRRSGISSSSSEDSESEPCISEIATCVRQHARLQLAIAVESEHSFRLSETTLRARGDSRGRRGGYPPYLSRTRVIRKHVLGWKH